MSNPSPAEESASPDTIIGGPGFVASVGDRILLDSGSTSGRFVITSDDGFGTFTVRPETRWERFVGLFKRLLTRARRALR